ncbi:unnamed protein product [Caenorhabditis brenneri]
MESVLEEARLPIKAISLAGKQDHVRAEKRLRTYFASKKLTMPGSYAPKNRINWKDATNASDTSSSGSKAPPNGFGNKKVSYRPKLTEDDKTKQKEDIPSNKPEIEYVELGLTEFVKNPFKTDTHNDPKAKILSDTASDESTEEPNISSSSVGRTDPGAVVTEDFNNTSQTAADSEEIGAAIIRIKAFLANPSLVELKGLAPANNDVTTLAGRDFQNELDIESFTAPLSSATSSLFRDELNSE